MSRYDEPTENFGVNNADRPTAWYRKRRLLMAWVVMVLILAGLIIWGLIVLFSGNSGPTFPQVPTSSTTTQSSTTTTTATTTTTTTTTQSVEPPATQAPQSSEEPATTTSTKHRLPDLPSTITVPKIPQLPDLPTEITLPPGL